MKTKIYEFDPVIYPTRLWVCKQPNVEDVAELFYPFDNNGERCDSFGDALEPTGEYANIVRVSNKEMLYWLKSLRPRPQWKPSEEQKAALWNAIGFIRHRVQYDWNSKNGSINGMDYPVMLKLLESIYNDLKEL